MNIFWALNFCEYLGGGVITIMDYIKGPFLCILGSFFKVNVQNGEYFFSC